MRRFSLMVLALGLCASAGVLWRQAAAMAEVPLAQAMAATRLMLSSTHLGLAWKIGMATLILAMAAIALATPGQSERALVSVGLAALAAFVYSRSMVSHASAAGDVSSMKGADWVHLMLIFFLGR